MIGHTPPKTPIFVSGGKETTQQTRLSGFHLCKKSQYLTCGSSHTEPPPLWLAGVDEADAAPVIGPGV